MNSHIEKIPEYSRDFLLESIYKIENDFSDLEKKQIQTSLFNALDFAEQKHKEQFRDSGEAYVEHLKRSLYNVFKLFESCIPREYIETIIISTILHDVIEDTEISQKSLKKIFGEDVSKIVGYISKNNLHIFNRNKTKRNKKYFESLDNLTNFKKDNGKTIILKHIALIIKAADRIDNLNTMCSWNIEKMLEKVKETVHYILPLYHKEHNKKIIKELKQSIKNALHCIEIKLDN